MPPLEPRDVDVAVVGAGIGGTAFALAAARRGWQVGILEKEDAPRAPVRPEILWDATVEALDRLDAGPRVRREAALPLEGLEVWHRGRRLLRLSRDDMAAGRTAPWATDPAATRRVLLEEALATGRVDHRAGHRATGLLLEGGRVVGVRGEDAKGPFAMRAPFVVGDDGSRSAVRDAAHVFLHAEPFPVEFILALAPRPSALPEREARAFLDPAGFRRGLAALLLMPLDARRVALVAAARHGTWAHDAQSPLGTFESKLRRLFPAHLDLVLPGAFPEGWTRAVRPVGHAERYWRPGVALVGDAAHPVSPVGGQGANMAVADALALADATLGTTPRGEAPSPAALAAYEAARRGPNAHSIRYSRRAAPAFRALWTLPPLAHALPPALRLLDASPRRKARFLHAVGSAFQARVS